MEIQLKQTDMVTEEKAKFVEEQANRLLAFTMESRAMLSKEAHTTLNWLFAVIVGSSGYVLSLFESPESVKWWIIIPLLVVGTSSAVQAAKIFHDAMRVMPVLPVGNEPKNLLTDATMQYGIEWIRISETASLQERIDKARDHNARVGDAINRARWTLTVLPAVGLIVAVLWRCFISV